MDFIENDFEWANFTSWIHEMRIFDVRGGFPAIQLFSQCRVKNQRPQRLQVCWSMWHCHGVSNNIVTPLLLQTQEIHTSQAC